VPGRAAVGVEGKGAGWSALVADLFALHVQAAAAPAHLPLRRAHVPEGVRRATHGAAGRQAVLPAVRECAAARPAAPRDPRRPQQLPAAAQGRRQRGARRAPAARAARQLPGE